jgi:hypothetical protein
MGAVLKFNKKDLKMIDWLISKMINKKEICRNCKYYHSSVFLGVSYCYKDKNNKKHVERSNKICFWFKKIKKEED